MSPEFNFFADNIHNYKKNIRKEKKSKNTKSTMFRGNFVEFFMYGL